MKAMYCSQVTASSERGVRHEPAVPVPTAPTIDPQARRWLRVEGLAVLVAAAVAFGQLGGEFIWFLPALLVPDLAIAGYLSGPRSGAFVYNLVHNWAIGSVVPVRGASGITPLAFAGTILVAHSGWTGPPDTASSWRRASAIRTGPDRKGGRRHGPAPPPRTGAASRPHATVAG